MCRRATGKTDSRQSNASAHRAFSLVELVLVIAILSIITAIAIPRMTRGSQNAQANALLQTLEAIRGAIDHYYAEHYRYPGYNPSDNSPDNQWFIDQLTLYSDLEGNVSRTPTSTHVYGPYLREPFPVNPINGQRLVRVRADGSVSVGTGASGWIANLDDGEFIINAESTDLTEIGMQEADIVVSLGKDVVVKGL